MKNNNFRTEFKQFCVDKNISNAAIARSIGVSGAAISNWLNEKYKGDNKSLENKLKLFVNNFNSKKSKPALTQEYYNTSEAKAIWFVIDEAIADNEMGLIYGDPGTGKTTAIKEYVKQHPEAMLIEADVYTNARSLLNQLCSELNIEMNSRDLHSKILAISAKLNQAEKLIIIDEAEHLPLKALEVIRRIHDFTSTPVILVGTRILLRNLKGRNGELAQLYSRIGVQWIMQGLSDEDYQAIYQEQSGIIKKYTNGIFRQATKLYRRATRLAQNNNLELDDNVIAEASKMLVLG